MFFKQRMEGIEFGYKVAEHIDGATSVIDEAMMQRLGLNDSIVNELPILKAHQMRIANSVLNKREFASVWIIAFKELIAISTNDRNANKINRGFAKYLKETYGDEDDIRELQKRVKKLIDDDETFGSTGFLQNYDFNNKVPVNKREGISYGVARLVVETALLRDELDVSSRGLLVSGLVVEFESIFQSVGKKYKSLKIV